MGTSVARPVEKGAFQEGGNWVAIGLGGGEKGNLLISRVGVVLLIGIVRYLVRNRFLGPPIPQYI